MSDPASHPAAPSYRAYLVIWAWLIALLAAGTLISYLPVGKLGAASLILGIAFIKTVLVVLFYMHMKFERLVPLWVVAASPFLLLLLAGLVVLIGPAIS